MAAGNRTSPKALAHTAADSLHPDVLAVDTARMIRDSGGHRWRASGGASALLGRRSLRAVIELKARHYANCCREARGHQGPFIEASGRAAIAKAEGKP